MPDWRYAKPDGTFGNRWDDPDGVYRVGYASSQREGTFVETLSRFRPDPKILANPPTPEVIAALIEQTGCDEASPAPGMLNVRVWTSKRMIGVADPVGRFADVGHSESLAELTDQLAHLLISFNLTEIDAGTIRGADIQLTQQISKYIFGCASEISARERKYDGIRYESRLGDEIFNWALFEPILLGNISESGISVEDPDLLEVAGRFKITLV